MYILMDPDSSKDLTSLFLSGIAHPRRKVVPKLGILLEFQLLLEEHLWIGGLSYMPIPRLGHSTYCHCCFVHSHPNYCNVLYINCPGRQFGRFNGVSSYKCVLVYPFYLWATLTPRGLLSAIQGANLHLKSSLWRRARLSAKLLIFLHPTKSDRVGSRFC